MRGVPAALSSAGGLHLSVTGLTKRCPKTMSLSPHFLPSPTCFSTTSSPGDPSASKPWLLAGLGNPGKTYQGTRHNVGYEMINAIAEAEGISVTNIHCKALLGKGCIGDVPVMLAKPQTFMNLSDLPFAKLRLLPKGGHGGQNGMRSVIDHLKGSRDFPRLRIGIGRPPGKMDPAAFVMKPFTKKEREEMEFTLQRGVQAVRILLNEGFNKSASFVNTAQPSELLN